MQLRSAGNHRYRHPLRLLLAGAAVALLAAIYMNTKDREGWAFLGTAVTFAMAVATYFLVLFPNVMPSTLDGGTSLTIENAASTRPAEV